MLPFIDTTNACVQVAQISYCISIFTSEGREGKGREGKGREGKGRKGREGKGREGKGREGKGREGKCHGRSLHQTSCLAVRSDKTDDPASELVVNTC